MTFEEQDKSQKRKTDEIARRISLGAEDLEVFESPGFALLNTLKRAQVEISKRAI